MLMVSQCSVSASCQLSWRTHTYKFQLWEEISRPLAFVYDIWNNHHTTIKLFIVVSGHLSYWHLISKFIWLHLFLNYSGRIQFFSIQLWIIMSSVVLGDWNILLGNSCPMASFLLDSTGTKQHFLKMFAVALLRW